MQRCKFHICTAAPHCVFSCVLLKSYCFYRHDHPFGQLSENKNCLFYHKQGLICKINLIKFRYIHFANVANTVHNIYGMYVTPKQNRWSTYANKIDKFCLHIHLQCASDLTYMTSSWGYTTNLICEKYDQLSGVHLQRNIHETYHLRYKQVDTNSHSRTNCG